MDHRGDCKDAYLVLLRSGPALQERHGRRHQRAQGGRKDFVSVLLPDTLTSHNTSLGTDDLIYRRTQNSEAFKGLAMSGEGANPAPAPGGASVNTAVSFSVRAFPHRQSRALTPMLMVRLVLPQPTQTGVGAAGRTTSSANAADVSAAAASAGSSTTGAASVGAQTTSLAAAFVALVTASALLA